MQASENPYASPKATSELSPSLEDTRQLDEQLAAAKRITRRPAIGMLVCSIGSAFLVMFPLGSLTFFGIQGLEVPWLSRFLINYWYLYTLPFLLYFTGSLFGSLSLLTCHNRMLAKVGVFVSFIPMVHPLFPFTIFFGLKGLAATREPEVQEAFRKAELDERSNRTRALSKLFGPTAIILFLEVVTIFLLLLPVTVYAVAFPVLRPEHAEQHMNVMLRTAGPRMVLVALGAGFVTFSAIQMLRARRYIFCVIGACLALIPFLSPCFFLGIPFGLWALVILLQKDTRAAFAEAN